MKIIDAHAHIVQVIAGFGSQGELRAQGRGKAVHARRPGHRYDPP